MLIVWKIWGFKIFQNLSISVCTCSTFTFLLTFLFRNFPPNSNTFRRTCIWIWQQNYNTRLFQNSFWPLYYSNSDILFWKHQKRSYWTKKISPLIFFRSFFNQLLFFLMKLWQMSAFCDIFHVLWISMDGIWSKNKLSKSWIFPKIVKFWIFLIFYMHSFF